MILIDDLFLLNCLGLILFKKIFLFSLLILFSSIGQKQFNNFLLYFIKNPNELLSLSSNKNISILKENNSIGTELENNIRKIIKEKYAKLKEEIIKEKNINVNNIINESKIINKFMENFKNNEKNKYKNIIHEGIACSSCGNYPIKGKRFKCCFCPSYDLCEDCEKTKAMIHSHPLFILKKEIINDD